MVELRASSKPLVSRTGSGIRLATTLSIAILLAPLAVCAEPPPGAEAYPPALVQTLTEARAALGPDYEPRTRHRGADGSARFTNRLMLEDSPYLRQHAHNPVDWYPWGPEAFERAARENRPVFLSIGYSSCHWCHVMESESFEDLDVARALNQHFIAVKVDRERRPDVDYIYMTATQLLAGHGGWPMTAFLTPDRKPFFGGTYLPRAELMRLLGRGAELWRVQPELAHDMAERVTRAVLRATASSVAPGEASSVDRALIERGLEQIMAQNDAGSGGFGPPAGPKFPREAELLFLLDQALRSARPNVLGAVLEALDAMAHGGIHDQIGGGFHRYAVDGDWRVPHFEKLLPNQAYLARTYARAYQLTGRSRYARVTRQILDYALRDMSSAEGVFYAASDADSEGGEGAYFVWSAPELQAALGEDASFAIELFGVTEPGGFEGHNVLYLPMSLESHAAKTGVPMPQLLARVERVRERLRSVRRQREPPLRDEKVLTAWNAMMVSALVQAAEVLDEPRYLRAAVRAAQFLWANSRRADGRFWRVHFAGRSSIDAVHEDYAHLLEALLQLLDATGQPVWRERAREVADAMIREFWDAPNGGFFMAAARDAGDLLSRPKQIDDGAAPSGNSVAIRALAAAALRLDEPRYRDHAEAALAAFAGRVGNYPAAYAYMLLGAAELLDGPAGPSQYTARGKLRAIARRVGSRASGATGWPVEVDLELAPGWHVNANSPLQPALIATSLSIESVDWALSDVVYPTATVATLAFSPEPLALYEGRSRLRAMLQWTNPEPPPMGAVAPLHLRVQACSEQVCLLPETVVLEVPIRY